MQCLEYFLYFPAFMSNFDMNCVEMSLCLIHWFSIVHFYFHVEIHRITLTSLFSFSVRNSTFKLGSDVNLTCSNRTWNETMFVIWNINLKIQPEVCKIAFDLLEKSIDTCRDGKSMRNTSSGQSYLHIPNFSNNDVGIYKCESIHKGGSDAQNINVNIIGKNWSMVVF